MTTEETLHKIVFSATYEEIVLIRSWKRYKKDKYNTLFEKVKKGSSVRTAIKNIENG